MEALEQQKIEQSKIEIKGLVKSFKNEELQTHVVQIKDLDPLDSLKYSLFDFFADRLAIIAKEEDFKNFIKQTLIKKIEGGEVAVPQLMALFNSINNQNNLSIECLLSFFKPSQVGNVSPLLDKAKGDQHKKMGETLDNLTPDESEMLNKLVKILHGIGERRSESD
jgi:hypothetical protein